MIKNIAILKSVLNQVKVKNKDFIFLITLVSLLTACEIISLGVLIPFVSTVFKVENNFLNYLQIFNNDKNKIFIFLLSILVIFLILKTIFALYTRWSICTFSFSQYANIQRKLLYNYQNMNFENFIQRNSSDYVTNIRELSAHTVSFIEAIIKILAEIIVVTFIFSFLLFLNYKILLYVFLIFIPIILFYKYFLAPINSKLGHKRNQAIKNTFKEVASCIDGIKEIKILKKGEFFLDNLLKNALIIKEVQQKTVLINESPRYVFELFLLIFGTISIYFLSLSHKNLISFIPTLSVYLLAGIRLLPSISFIVSNINRAAELLPSTEKINADLKNLQVKKNISLNDENNSIPKGNNLKEINSISMKNVSFSYDNSKKIIFENIDFIIKKNDCIGVIGKSGSGKTTFVDILLGLLKPKEGELIINEKLFPNNEFLLFGNIAYLPQNPVILDESIKTNVTLEINEEKINSNELSKSISNANLEDFIKELPKNLDTLIGENGVRLSVGQNKRLALARTFYHKKNFIIMDEATSSQDNFNQDLIAEQIKKIKGKFTILIISHQMNVLKYCDKIYKVENKKIFLDKKNNTHLKN